MPGLDYYFYAWDALTTCRSLADMDPIPWTAVHMWAQAEDMSRDSRDDLWYYIQKMDDVFLKIVADKRKNVKP